MLFVETDEPSWFRNTLVSKKIGEGHPSSKQGIIINEDALLINNSGRILPQRIHSVLHIKNQDLGATESDFMSFLTCYKSMLINYQNVVILEDACLKHKYRKNTGERERQWGLSLEICPGTISLF